MITARTFPHRALVQRNAETDKDPYGGDAEEDFQTHIESLRCRYWVASGGGALGREIEDSAKSAVILDARVIAPRGTDITEADRILEVKDRVGNVIVSRPLTIQAVAKRKDHLELVVQEVRSG